MSVRGSGWWRVRRGFSVMELLVVVTIIGLLGAAAIPRFARTMAQTNVQRAAHKLQTDVQQAFAIAGRNRRAVVLRWSSTDLELQVTDRTQSTIYRRTGIGAKAGLNLTSSDITVYPTTLTVFPNGLAVDTLYIKLSKSGYSRTIRVSKAGIVRLQ